MAIGSQIHPMSGIRLIVAIISSQKLKLKRYSGLDLKARRISKVNVKSTPDVMP